MERERKDDLEDRVGKIYEHDPGSLRFTASKSRSESGISAIGKRDSTGSNVWRSTGRRIPQRFYVQDENAAKRITGIENYAALFRRIRW